MAVERSGRSPAEHWPASTATITVPASAAAGSYYVIAQADGAGEVLETTETNNTRASAAIKVGPDLVVTAVSVPSSGAAGGTIAATDTTRNQGAGPATASSTGFYLSVNNTLSPDDKFLGNRSVGELAANGTSTGQALLQIPADTLPGSYYVVARTDWNDSVKETTETNNDRSSGVIRVGGDLVADVDLGLQPRDGRWPHHGHRDHQESGRGTGRRINDRFLSVH